MINVTYLENCECHNIGNSSTHCQNNGISICGDCSCSQGWTGKDCSRSCSRDDLRSCWQNVQGEFQALPCSGNGDCDCGKCICNFPYEGKVCQFQCPVNKNKKCSGPAQGKCIDGSCTCETGFKGETCSCSLSTDHCTIGGTLCSGNGDCECNQCQCKKDFHGRYCEYNNKNYDVNCEKYNPLVETWCLDPNAVNSTHPENYPTVMYEVDENHISTCYKTCVTRIYEGSSICEVDYCYYDANNSLQIPIVKKCFMTAGLKGTVGGLLIVLFTIIAGLIILAGIKCKRYREDRIEYEKFRKSQNTFNLTNPVYRNPVMHYHNPMSDKKD